MNIPFLNIEIPAKWVAGALAVVFVGAAATDCFYQVEPNEVANIRRMNNVLYDTPVGNGVHMKAPFIDSVDKVQTSLRTLKIPMFSVNTIDNQKIDLEINFNYLVPASSANHILYGIGQVGSGENDDIDDSIIPVAMDRAGRVFARQNTTDISLNRETIQTQVTDDVFNAVRELFRIEPQSLQIAKIGYSNTFNESNDVAVRNKNKAVEEENKRAVATAVATQQVTEATGRADSAINEATGEAGSIMLKATAGRDALVLEAQGEKERLLKEIAPFGTSDAYIEFLRAQVALKWQGQRPQVEISGGDTAPGTGPAATVVVPMPPRP